MSADAKRFAAAPALIVPGLAGAVIGACMLLYPQEFHATAGIALRNDTNLLNEMRAYGGAVLTCGLFVAAGAFRSDLTIPSAVLATLLYLAFGLSRAFSVVIDGAPSDMLAIVAVAEIAMGLLCAAILAKVRNR